MATLGISTIEISSDKTVLRLIDLILCLWEIVIYIYIYIYTYTYIVLCWIRIGIEGPEWHVITNYGNNLE